MFRKIWNLVIDFLISENKKSIISLIIFLVFLGIICLLIGVNWLFIVIGIFTTLAVKLFVIFSLKQNIILKIIGTAGIVLVIIWKLFFWVNFAYLFFRKFFSFII